MRREEWRSGADTAQTRRTAAGLGDGILLVLCSWSLLLAAAALEPLGVARDVALFAAFLLGTLLAAAGRPHRPDRRRSVSVLLLGMGLLAGFATFPALVGLIASAGLALGLTPGVPIPPGAGTPLLWLSTLGLAPIFEELVYRERLLPALARRFGTLPALVLSSAAFALPHLEPWTVLATFLVGLALGAVMRGTGAVVLCIGLHMGLNLAALVLGVGAAESLFQLGVSAVAGGLVLLAALGLAAGRADPSWQG
jgi:membrane protease YdiL (CAAX protease family)